MKNETPRQLVRTPEIRSAFAGDPFIEPAQEINDLIARRAYELFESSGFTLCLAKIKSACEINNMQRCRVTCYT